MTDRQVAGLSSAIDAPTTGATTVADGINGAEGDRIWRRHGSIPNRDAGLPASIAMWDRYMELKYADIRVEDLVGENYLTLFTDFCSKMGECWNLRLEFLNIPHIQVTKMELLKLKLRPE